MNCEYCDAAPSVHVDFAGRNCCEGCWDKDWTAEDQAELDRLSKEVSARLGVSIPKILAENGLPADSDACICLSCRGIVQIDENGTWYCKCKSGVIW